MTETARMTALKTINADRLLIRCAAAGEHPQWLPAARVGHPGWE